MSEKPIMPHLLLYRYLLSCAHDADRPRYESHAATACADPLAHPLTPPVTPCADAAGTPAYPSPEPLPRPDARTNAPLDAPPQSTAYQHPLHLPLAAQTLRTDVAADRQSAQGKSSVSSEFAAPGSQPPWIPAVEPVPVSHSHPGPGQASLAEPAAFPSLSQRYFW